MVVATFTCQELTSVTLEHCAYCPMPTQLLDRGAYINRGEKVPL